MDDRFVSFAGAAKGIIPQHPRQVRAAVVQSVEGVTCTVELLGTDLEPVAGVALRADEEATEGVLLTPTVGSLVYVAAVDNTLDQLFVCQFSEIDAATITLGDVAVSMDKNGVAAQMGDRTLTLTDAAATLTDGQATVEARRGKVSVKNGSTSLKTLFDDLTDLLTSFQVTCAAPGSPSAPFPASTAKVALLKTKANTLLQ